MVKTMPGKKRRRRFDPKYTYGQTVWLIEPVLVQTYDWEIEQWTRRVVWWKDGAGKVNSKTIHEVWPSESCSPAVMGLIVKRWVDEDGRVQYAFDLQIPVTK